MVFFEPEVMLRSRMPQLDMESMSLGCKDPSESF